MRFTSVCQLTPFGHLHVCVSVCVIVEKLLIFLLIDYDNKSVFVVVVSVLIVILLCQFNVINIYTMNRVFLLQMLNGKKTNLPPFLLVSARGSSRSTSLEQNREFLSIFCIFPNKLQKSLCNFALHSATNVYFIDNFAIHNSSRFAKFEKRKIAFCGKCLCVLVSARAGACVSVIQFNTILISTLRLLSNCLVESFSF